MKISAMTVWVLHIKKIRILLKRIVPLETIENIKIKIYVHDPVVDKFKFKNKML